MSESVQDWSMLRRYSMWATINKALCSGWGTVDEPNNMEKEQTATIVRTMSPSFPLK